MLSKLLFGVLAACASPSFACDNYPDLPTLPGETIEANKARNDRLYERLSIIRTYEGQKFALEKATSIYLARVLKRESLSRETPRFGLLVEPAHAMKGEAPAKERRLSEMGPANCGLPNDDDATAAVTGDWVIVFEGLSKSQHNPDGVFVLSVRDALIWDLVEQVEEFSLARGGRRP